MNIINLKRKESRQYFDKVLIYMKNKEVMWVTFFTIFIFIVQLLGGVIKNSNISWFLIEIVKSPVMFFLPFVFVIKNRNIYFYFFLGIIFLLTALLNLTGFSHKYYSHNPLEFEKIGAEMLPYMVLYIIPLIFIFIKYCKKSIKSILAGVIIAFFILFNYFAVKKPAEVEMYISSNYYIYFIIALVSIYFAAIEENFYRGYLLETFLKNGIRRINAFIFIAVIQAAGIVLADFNLRTRNDIAMQAFLFLAVCGMFFNYIYLKTGRNIVASVISRAALLFVYFLSYYV